MIDVKLRSLICAREQVNDYVDRAEVTIMEMMRHGLDPAGQIDYLQTLKSRAVVIHKDMLDWHKDNNKR